MKIKVLPVWKETQTPIETCVHEEEIPAGPWAYAEVIGTAVSTCLRMVKGGFVEVYDEQLEFRVTFENR